MFSPRRGCRYWRNLGLFTLATLIAAGLFLIYGGHPYFLSRGWTHPNSPAVCCQTPADHGLAYADAAFETHDGLTLRGWYIPSQNGAAVILTHPLGANRLSVLGIAAALAEHGYGVLLFDIRSHGESDGDRLPYGGDEFEDIRAAATYLQARPEVGEGRIGAMGLSLGAQLSIMGAAQSGQVQAVAADAPCCTVFADLPAPQTAGDWSWVPYDLVFFKLLQWHGGVRDPMPLREAIARISPRPLLLIGGGSDRRMPEGLYQAAGEPKELWIIPEAAHIGGFQKRPQEYAERIVRFFDQALLN